MRVFTPEFNLEWYKNFIQHTNEKDLLVSKISGLLEGKPCDSCLEIGLGISPYFARQLSKCFKKYIIIEKRIMREKLSSGVELVNADWEDIEFKEKFDVIIASHVIYYFKDKQKAIDKIFDTLKDDGRVIFVVNGKNADYGPLKLAFSKMINRKYIFTYEKLIKLLKGKPFKEYAFPSLMKFSSFEELFEILKLSFDSWPDEYKKLKEKIIFYLKENIKADKFIIDQKIIEVEK